MHPMCCGRWAVLQCLAFFSELALVGTAATAGTRGYVLGRTHTTCGFGSALGRLALRVVRSRLFWC